VQSIIHHAMLKIISIMEWSLSLPLEVAALQYVMKRLYKWYTNYT